MTDFVVMAESTVTAESDGDNGDNCGGVDGGG